LSATFRQLSQGSKQALPHKPVYSRAEAIRKTLEDSGAGAVEPYLSHNGSAALVLNKVFKPKLFVFKNFSTIS